jgi:hypothetical protein
VYVCGMVPTWNLPLPHHGGVLPLVSRTAMGLAGDKSIFLSDLSIL